MNDFPFLTNVANPGGLMLVEYTPIAGIAGFPAIVNNKITAPLTFAAGARWYSVYGSMTKKGYEEGAQDTDHGTIYEPAVKLFYPWDTEATRQLLGLMPFHRFVLRVTDNNGFRRLVGTPWQGLEFKYKMGTGTAMDGSRGYDMMWTGNLTKIPPVYAAST